MLRPNTFDTEYYASGGTVHHTYNDCVDGRRIPDTQRVEGNGDKPRCPKCEARDHGTVETFGGTVRY